MNHQKIEKLKGYRKILYTIDMVNGFVNEGALHDKHIRETIPEQIKLIEKFKQEQEGIAFIKDCHTKDSIEFKNYPPHCIEGTSEALLVPELQPYEQEALVYQKNSTSAMFAPNMISNLDAMENLEEVVGIGCCTDICDINFLIPLKNYFNQKNRDITIFAVKKAMDTFHIPQIHDRNHYIEMAYTFMEQAGIILVNDINELIKREKEMGLIRRKEKR